MGGWQRGSSWDTDHANGVCKHSPPLVFPGAHACTQPDHVSGSQGMSESLHFWRIIVCPPAEGSPGGSACVGLVDWIECSSVWSQVDHRLRCAVSGGGGDSDQVVPGGHVGWQGPAKLGDGSCCRTAGCAAVVGTTRGRILDDRPCSSVRPSHPVGVIKHKHLAREPPDSARAIRQREFSGVCNHRSHDCSASAPASEFL